MSISDNQLERWIDCGEDDKPSLNEIQMMASEIMRLRSYGAMVPEADDDLKQRAAILYRAFKDKPKIEQAIDRIQSILSDDIGTDMKSVVLEMLTYVIGDSVSLETGDWIEINVSVLNDIDNIIQDAVGFGMSHGPSLHNTALNNVRKYISNAEGSNRTLIPKTLIGESVSAIREIVYGKKYPERDRLALIDALQGMLSTGPFPLPK